jgi:hypothetical protein
MDTFLGRPEKKEFRVHPLDSDVLIVSRAIQLVKRGTKAD